MSECSICGAEGETRHISIYVSGSEGINPCLSCELSIVSFVTSMRSTATRARLAYIKRAKELKNKEPK